MRRTWESVFGYFLLGDCQAMKGLCLDKVVLEIGCLYGKSTLCIAEVAKEVITVDTFKAHDNGVDQMDDYTTLEIFQKNIKGYKNISWIIGRSEDVIPEIDKIFDVVFIDGWHKYEQVVKDIEVCWPKLKDGGVMAFHDYNTYHHEVGRAVKELNLPIEIPGGDIAYIVKPRKKYPFKKPKVKIKEVPEIVETLEEEKEVEEFSSEDT